jgi:UPF0271 protein
LNTTDIKIDINADLGEGAGNDAAIMPLISSCNIACGGHTGTVDSMLKTIRLAQKHGVKIGAHPSFPDQDNFGRKVLTMTKSELTESIYHQLLAFFALCETEQIEVHHIKLHGALYNYAAKDAPTADAVVEAITKTKLRPKLYVPMNSVLAAKAENLLPLVYEAFIDRRYNDDLSLVARSEADALIEDSNDAWIQLKEMATEQLVTTRNGIRKPMNASTYCIHGDHAQSVEILNYIHKQLKLSSIILI